MTARIGVLGSRKSAAKEAPRMGLVQRTNCALTILSVGRRLRLTEKELESLYATFPTTLDVLITHGPPYGTCDRTFYGEHAGSHALQRYLLASNVGVVVCGHIHCAHSVQMCSNTAVYNVSILDEGYKQQWNVTTIELEPLE